LVNLKHGWLNKKNELGEEIIEAYTIEQEQAYKEIKNAKSYKGATRILSTNEISPLFDIEACADIAILSYIESEMGNVSNVLDNINGEVV